jgi:hypothetical protein
MAIYSTGDGIRVQAQSPHPEWNRTAEAYFAMWSPRCEVTRRFSFEECQALVCRGMDIDGEYFIHKTRDVQGEPRIQLIESHRVGDQFGSQETIDGVGIDAWGAPVFYRTLEDNGKPSRTAPMWRWDSRPSRITSTNRARISARKSNAAPAMRSSFSKPRGSMACQSTCSGNRMACPSLYQIRKNRRPVVDEHNLLQTAHIMPNTSILWYE